MARSNAAFSPAASRAASFSGMGWEALAAMLLIGAAFITFWPTTTGEFLNWDDDRNFTENPSYQGLGAQQLRWSWTTYHLGVWQPVAWMILSVQYAIGGLNPRTYHIASILFHAVNSVLVYWVVLRILRLSMPDMSEKSRAHLRMGCFLAALLFAIHPLRVETVAWVSSQPYLPAVGFALAAILVYLSAHSPGSSRARHGAFLAMTFVCYGLAVMCKSVAVTLPALLILLDVFPLKRLGGAADWFGKEARNAIFEKIPFLIVATIVSVWAMQAKDFNESRSPFAETSINQSLAQAAYGVAFYLEKTIVPTGLIAYYRLPKDISLAQPLYAACALFVVGVSVLLFTLRRRWPWLLVAWLAYLVILLPNLGLIQISRQIAADRYAYFASLPLVILLAAWLARISGNVTATASAPGAAGPARRVIATTACVAAALVLGALTQRQCHDWRDSATLWAATLHVDPACAVAECQLGAAEAVRGRLDDAATHLQRAIDIEPTFTFAHVNLAAIHLSQGRFEEVTKAVEAALTMDPPLYGQDLGRAHAILGAAYAGLDEADLAWTHTLKARELGFAPSRNMIDLLSEKWPRSGN